MRSFKFNLSATEGTGTSFDADIDIEFNDVNADEMLACIVDCIGQTFSDQFGVPVSAIMERLKHFIP